jgi:hypothetical protein
MHWLQQSSNLEIKALYYDGKMRGSGEHASGMPRECLGTWSEGQGPRGIWRSISLSIRAWVWHRLKWISARSLGKDDPSGQATGPTKACQLGC